MFEFEVSAAEANYWWRQTTPIGALLNKLILVFVVAPIALVLKRFYGLSFMVFAFMVPYGLFVRYLAVRAVRQHLEDHPEQREEFEHAGIISC
jgi:hypothetical protein